MNKAQVRLRVTLMSLLFSAISIGTGVGCYMAVLNWQPRHDYTDWLGIAKAVWPGIQFLAAGPLIGAGIFRLFARARLGAYVGFFAPIIAVLGYAVFLIGWRDVFREQVVIQVAALIVLTIAVASCAAVYQGWKRRRNGPTSGNPISD
jgi:hypothetical protein